MTVEQVLAIIAGALAVYVLIEARGRSILGWAVLILAVVLALPL